MKGHRDHHEAIAAFLREHSVAYEVEHGGKHVKYRFPDGRCFTTASTPSDWRATMNALTDLRRMLGIRRVIVHSAHAPRKRNKVRVLEMPSVTVMPDPWERLRWLKERMEPMTWFEKTVRAVAKAVCA